MKSYQTQSEFSKLYWKYQNTPLRYPNNITTEQPFDFIDYFVEHDVKIYPYVSEFNEKFDGFKKMKSLKENAYFAFELEYNYLFENRIKYLNAIVAGLISIQKTLTNKRRDVQQYDRVLIRLNLLNNITQEILKDIFITYHLELNATNRDILSRRFYLKKPILSFKLRKNIDDNKLERLYNQYLRHKFIPFHTEFQTFKSLFNHRTLLNKINWIEDKSSLYYFIKLLVQEQVIKDPKNRHWAIVAEFFLLKGEILLSNDLLNQKPTMDSEKRRLLSKFVLALKDPHS